ncbi:transglutaminase family protein [soil metagenome]
MRYRIRHVTEYTYQEAVSVCHNRLCLSPLSSDTQKCLSFDLKIFPVPDDLTKRVDFFGNELVFFSAYKEHDRLEIVSTSEVITEKRTNAGRAENSFLKWEDVKGLLASSPTVNYDVMAYTLPSKHIPSNSTVQDFFRDCFNEGDTLWNACRLVMNKIHKSIEFKPGFTTVNTPVDFVLRTKKGVCQDFAHLMITCFRNLGIPAQYVSGYIETLPPPGKPKLTGSDASHAWVSIYFPTIGWVEFDPTNNLLPSERHITVAYGRDYQDVAPIKGIIFSSGKQRLEVRVDVEQVGI